jgi:hypothetical protein
MGGRWATPVWGILGDASILNSLSTNQIIPLLSFPRLPRRPLRKELRAASCVRRKDQFLLSAFLKVWVRSWKLDGMCKSTVSFLEACLTLPYRPSSQSLTWPAKSLDSFYPLSFSATLCVISSAAPTHGNIPTKPGSLGPATDRI